LPVRRPAQGLTKEPEEAMKAKEITNLSTEELKSEASRLRREVYDLGVKAVTEKLDNPRQPRQVRKDLARVLTEANKRKSQTAGK
jgi:large subunit ribosomal protein L29